MYVSCLTDYHFALTMDRDDRGIVVGLEGNLTLHGPNGRLYRHPAGKREASRIFQIFTTPSLLQDYLRAAQSTSSAAQLLSRMYLWLRIL